MAAMTTIDHLYEGNETVRVSTLHGIQDSIIDLYGGKYSGREIVLGVWDAKSLVGATLDTGLAWWEVDSGQSLVCRIPVGAGDTIDSVVVYVLQNGASNIDVDINILDNTGAETTAATLAGGATEGVWEAKTILPAYTLTAGEGAYIRINGANTNDGYAGARVVYSRT